MNSTLRGITTDCKADPQNANSSIRFNDDGDSNKIDSRDRQPEKQCEQRISTRVGIIIDRSDDSENADDSIRFNDDGDSNEIESSQSQREKL
jgi:hypothetical protein